MKEVTYSIGQYFKDLRNDEVYILTTSADDDIIMICLNDGGRWADSLRVHNSQNISEEDFKNYMGERHTHFEKITKREAIELLSQSF